MNRAGGRALVSLLLVAALAGVPVASATATAPPTQVGSCTTIDEPGRYVLTGDITNSSGGRCLHVRASDVVLDGQGHTVNTGGAAAISVNASGPLANVTVRDVRVTGARVGVEVDNVVDARVVGVEAEQNGVGILLYGTRTAAVRDGTASANNVAGVGVRDGTGTLVENVTTRGNIRTSFGDPAGIALYGTTEATLRNNDIAEEYDGIALRDSDGIRVVGNTIRSSNSGVAVLAGATGNRLADNRLRNTRIVLQVRDDAVPMSDNVVAGNDVEEGSIVGGELARNLTVRDNDLASGSGISVTGADSRAARNVVRETAGTGIEVGGANATVRQNRVAGAGGAGIHVRAGGDGARLAANELVENEGHGVAVGTDDGPGVSDVVLRDTDVRDSGGQAFRAAGGSTATARNVTLLTATLDVRARNAAFEPLGDPPAPPEGTAGVGQYLRTAETGDEARLDVRFHYEADAVGDVEESTLRLYGHDGEWRKLESEVDPENDTVAGTLRTFGAVGVLGETDATNGSTPTATPTEENDSSINPTVRPGWTPTPSPTPTATPTPTVSESATETTTTTLPGFGVVGALVALLACAFVRRAG